MSGYTSSPSKFLIFEVLGQETANLANANEIKQEKSSNIVS